MGDLTEVSASRFNRLRPEVARSAEMMEAQLKANDHKSGWSDCSLQYLMTRLMDEIEELHAAIMSGMDPELVWGEAADAQNFLMMIADRYEQGAKIPS